ncbi:DUF6259 domain-containing protein [Kineosporia sp. A_224]|uniref:DUF6259 domain-containing protein n=1 Tax=Kineosporia sp. A_224 TaxID=1962180 RepID=UPI000B4B1FA9|nr:DUF6259 domain-containing protein [Kineosporia sp. A_224]
MSDETVLVGCRSLVAELARADGSIVGLCTADGSWTLLGDEALGLGFALRVPLDERRHNVADSRAQDAPVWSELPDGDGVQAEWPSLVSEHGGRHNIAVRVSVRAIEDRLVLGMEIDNQSDLVVEDVRFPWLGDVAHRDPERPLFSVAPGYADAQRRPFRPTFVDSVPYFGVDTPTWLNGPMRQHATTPSTPFVLVEDGEHGFYLGVDESADAIVGWVAELRPGYGDSLRMQVPAADVAAPEPTCLRVAAVHVPYLQPGERTRLTPIALASFVGGWQSGAAMYRDRRRSWSTPATPPSWAAEPDAWLQLQVNSPEDELRLPFSRLPEVAASCAAHGVRTIQLVGWNTGGQDRNNPDHTPDARLGGAPALREAIARCHELDVRVVLFAKFTWADRTTRRYRDELVHEAIKDPYGDPYVFEGFMYNTVTQMLGINLRGLVPMCFGSETYRAICERDVEGIVDLGADGMLFDECLHHGQALLCFDTSHGHRRAAPVFAHDIPLARRFADLAAARRRDFLLAGEACYDTEFEAYQLSYHRSFAVDHVPLTRFLHPHAALMTAVIGFDDRDLVGQALLYRYVLSYEPYHFQGRLEDFPLTVAYGRAMDDLRTRWRRWFWDGEYQDTLGARVVDVDGTAHHPYSVFRPVDEGPLGVAVANYGERPVRLLVQVGDCDQPLSSHVVDGAGWVRGEQDGTGTWIELPTRSAALVLPTTTVERRS